MSNALGMEIVGQTDSPLASGTYVSDGTVTLALLQYKADEWAGRNKDDIAINHIGFWVDDLEEQSDLIKKNGGTFFKELPLSKDSLYYEMKFLDPNGIIFDVSHKRLGRGVEVTSQLIPADANASAGAISIRGLSKTFGALKVLEDVNCTIGEAEFVSILGPSGCGKSTILRIIAGLIAPDNGAELSLLGQPLTGHSEQVGVVFQTHNMLPWLTVEKNIRLNCEVRGIAREEISRRVDEILPVLKLEGFSRQVPAPDIRWHEAAGRTRPDADRAAGRCCCSTSLSVPSTR